MSLPDERVLALGNTASVMPSLAKTISNLFVAFPTNVTSPVLQGNEKCFPARQLNYPLSVSCFKFVRRMAGTFGCFHAELGYAVACNAARVRYGVHIHGVTDISLLFPKTALGRILKRPYSEALANASYVVCHPAVLDFIRRLRKDAIDLPLPIDADQFNANVAPFDYGGGFAIFSPSRMDQWKGHEVIWEALRLMKNGGKVKVFQSDWGWEPSYSYFKRHAPENVRFIPTVPRDRIAAYFRGANLVIGQMKIGHFGMTELEAAACGVPVLVNLQDKDTPFLPKSGKSQSLAEAMDKLVEDSSFRMSYAKSCSDYVLPLVGLTSVSSRLLAVLAASERGRQRKGGRMLGLFLGTGFELIGRIIGERLFEVLKTSLISL